jgi:hypothetical protein
MSYVRRRIHVICIQRWRSDKGKERRRFSLSDFQFLIFIFKKRPDKGKERGRFSKC